jgi:hypothetical protein
LKGKKFQGHAQKVFLVNKIRKVMNDCEMAGSKAVALKKPIAIVIASSSFASKYKIV